KKRLKKLVFSEDVAGKFAWTLLAQTLLYSARRLGEIADDIVSIDQAMRWGFNWDLGPFEAWDAIGVADSVAKMKQDGLAVPEWVEAMLATGRASFYEGSPAAPSYFDPRSKTAQPVPSDPKQIRLVSLKAEPTRVVKKNHGASLVDLGDGVLCVEFHSKMNAIGGDTIQMLHAGLKEASANFAALVVGNEGEHFSAGANIMLLLLEAREENWDEVDLMVRAFQNATMSLRYADVPVIVAP